MGDFHWVGLGGPRMLIDFLHFSMKNPLAGPFGI